MVWRKTATSCATKLRGDRRSTTEESADENTIRFFYTSLLETSVLSDYLECGRTESILNGEASQDDLYQDAADKYGSALERLARAYEADPEKRRDLIQEIHFQLWRSF